MKDYTQKISDIERPIAGLGIFGGKLNYIKQQIDDYFVYSCKNFDNLSALYKNLEKDEFFNEIDNQYNKLRKEIQDNIDLSNIQKYFLVQKIDENIVRMKIIYNAIEIEYHKKAYNFRYFDGDRHIQKSSILLLSKEQKYIDYLQGSIYGNSITDTIEERDDCLGFLCYKLNKNKKRITEQEKLQLQNFINNFKDFVYDEEKKYSKSKKKLLQGSLLVDDIKKISEMIRKSFYPEINWIQETEPGRSNYNVSFVLEKRKYPDKQNDLINKVFTVIGHEDGTHMIRGYNHKKHGLKVSGSGYEDIEEGLAKMNESLKSTTFDDLLVYPTSLFISVFVAENLDIESAYNILRIYHKLITNPKNYDNIDDYSMKVSNSALEGILRAKSYANRSGPGANRKDTIYYRGEKRLISYLKSLPDDEQRLDVYNKLMSAKLSMDSILSNQYNELLQNNDIVQNPLVDKVLYKKIITGYGAFNNSLVSKDGSTNKQKNLLDGDFRTKGMKKYTYNQKRTLINVLSLMGYTMLGGKYIKQCNSDSSIEDVY